MLIQLNHGQYEKARSSLGPEYSKALGKYVDVEGEVGDGKSAKQFKQAQQAQQNYTNSVHNYRQTYQKYQQAKKDGNDQKARKLARKLDRISKHANQNASSLQHSYKNLGNQTKGNFTKANKTVTGIQKNISATQQTVQESEFNKTNLTVTANKTEMSFRSPTRLTGTLTSESNNTFANQSVTLKVGNQTINTTTNESGSFQISYRPVTLPVSKKKITIQYIPPPNSTYLGSNTSLPAEVSQNQGRIHLTNVSKTTKLGNKTTITGYVLVNGMPVQSLPLNVTIGGKEITTTETNANGSFTVQSDLPVTVPDGQQSVIVQPSVTHRAVNATPAKTSIKVKPTQTKLKFASVNASGSTVAIAGRLTTLKGQTFSNQSVEFRVNGAKVQTAQTDKNGTFQTQFQIPQSKLSKTKPTRVTIVGQFQGKGTNLGTSRTKATVTIPPIGGEQTQTWLGISKQQLMLLAGALVTGVVLLGSGGWFLTRSSQSDIGEREDLREDVETVSEPSTPNIAQSLLETAREHLSAGETDTTVEVAYTAVRQKLSSAFPDSSPQTHWEFYHHYRDAVGSNPELRELTKLYEKASYSQLSLDRDTAERALTLATSLLKEKEPADESQEDN